jgi:CPA1 family monovalent cation:H+ antiporter
MEDLTILNSTLSVFTLLSVATLTAYCLKKSKFPYTVALVFMGALAGFVGENVQAFSFLQGFKFSPELVFYVFLPTLIFESSFHINFSHFRQNFNMITWLSTIGLMINAMIIASVLNLVLGFDIITSLLFGALISPTDPIAVIALFKKVGAPKRLTTIVEGESLANDGMALVFFQLILGFAMSQSFDGFKFSGVIGSLSLNIFGGLLVGTVLGFAFSKMLDYVKNSKEIEISITLILAHSTFLIADHFFSVSGILATVAAGLVIGNYGAYKISPVVKDIMIHFWDYMAFVANSLLFLIVGMVIWSIKGQILPLWESILIVLAAVIIARAVVTYTMVPIINVLFPKERVSLAWMHIIQWSGLRGALVMALVLSLPTDLAYYNEILIFSVSVIFFTIVFNGITMEPLLSKLGIKKFSLAEEFEYDEAKVLIDKKVTEKFDLMYKKGFIQKEVYEKVKESFEKDVKIRLTHLNKLLSETESALCNTQLTDLLKRHLFGVEKRVYNKLYFYDEITQDLLTILLQTLDLQIENTTGQRVRLGRLTLFNPEGMLIKSLDRLGLFDISDNLKKKEVMLRFEMYRARVIATTYVLKEIESLRKTELFKDQKMLDAFEEMYEEWNAKSTIKLDRLELKDCIACEDIRLFLAQKVAKKIELASINEFFKFGIISEKVKSKLYADLEIKYTSEIV